MNKFFSSAALSLSVILFTASAMAQDVKGDIKVGEKKASMCIGCHGIQGYQASFPEVYRVPMISGQNGKYIAAALKAYKEGERKHPTMRSVAASLSDQDMADFGAYYEQHGRAGAAAAPAASKAPSAKVKAILDKSACATCHGANFSKPLDPSQPKLAGQHKDYLYLSLKAYKTEGNAKVGRSNGVMAGIVKPLSLDEMKELANYISSLDGELTTTPQSKFR
jgi:cytochrome c553